MRIFRFSVKNCFHKNLTQTVKHSQNCNRLITHEQGFTLSKTVIQLSQAFPGDDEGFDSQDRDRNYSTEEGGWSPNGSPSQTVCYGPDKDTENEYRSYLRNDLPQFRVSLDGWRGGGGDSFPFLINFEKGNDLYGFGLRYIEHHNILLDERNSNSEASH